jgi:hypothetical protein
VASSFHRIARRRIRPSVVVPAMLSAALAMVPFSSWPMANACSWSWSADTSRFGVACMLAVLVGTFGHAASTNADKPRTALTALRICGLDHSVTLDFCNSVPSGDRLHPEPRPVESAGRRPAPEP